MSMITVIVPVFNLVPWIQECLDSILHQSIVDWECIVVDDGSTDETSLFIDECAARDCRIKVIHQRNKGEGCSRNTGLAVAQGEWVFFLDGDDVIAQSALEKLSDLIAKYPQENLFRFGIHSFEDGVKWQARQEESFCIRKDISAEICMSDFYTFVCQHLYKRKMIEGIKFKRYKRGCDRVYIDDVLLNRVNSFVETTAVLYGYRQRTSSAVHIEPTVQVIEDEMMHRCDIVKMIEMSAKKVVYRGSWWLEGYFTRVVCELATHKTKDEQDRIWTVWKWCIGVMLDASGLSWRTRFLYRLCHSLFVLPCSRQCCGVVLWYNAHGILSRLLGKMERSINAWYMDNCTL